MTNSNYSNFGDKLIKKGADTAEVQYLQDVLSKTVAFELPATENAGYGTFGPKTTAGLLGLQHQLGLRADAVFGPVTQYGGQLFANNKDDLESVKSATAVFADLRNKSVANEEAKAVADEVFTRVKAGEIKAVEAKKLAEEIYEKSKSGCGVVAAADEILGAKEAPAISGQKIAAVKKEEAAAPAMSAPENNAALAAPQKTTPVSNSNLLSTGANIRNASFTEYFTMAQEGFDSTLSTDIGGKVVGFGTQYDIRSGEQVKVSSTIGGQKIDVATGYALAYPMMEHKVEKAREIVPKFDELKPYQQAAVADLVYNLKSSRTNTAEDFKAGYPKLCRALENGDFEAASKQLGSGSKSREDFRQRLFSGEDPVKIAEDLANKVATDNRNVDMSADEKKQFVEDIKASAEQFKSAHLAAYEEQGKTTESKTAEATPQQPNAPTAMNNTQQQSQSASVNPTSLHKVSSGIALV